MDRHPVAVCISGMHRSGTSMVAGALARSGLCLGPPDRLMPAQADNPEGFAENVDLVRLTDELLERLGGAWDAPPTDPLTPGAPIVEELRPRAEALLAAVASRSPEAAAWGWKDPRICLTLPFWLALQPALQVVVCLRHPTAVARSLQQRHRSSLVSGLRLWTTYHRHLLAALPAGRFVVTHYDAWFIDAPTELTRVLRALGVPATEARSAAAVQVRPTDRHHDGDSMDRLAILGGSEALAYYDHLRSLAGPVYSATREGAATPASASAAAWKPHPLAGQDGTALGRDELQWLRHRHFELVETLERLQRPGDYRHGDLIDARLGGNAPLYLGEGWAPPQAAGTWSVGPNSRISLHLIDPGNVPLRLSARLRPLLASTRTALTVAVLANGSAVGEVRLDAPHATTVDLPLPPAAPDGRIALELRIDDPRSPRDLGLSADQRQLGVLLANLRISTR